MVDFCGLFFFWLYLNTGNMLHVNVGGGGGGGDDDDDDDDDDDEQEEEEEDKNTSSIIVVSWLLFYLFYFTNVLYITFSILTLHCHSCRNLPLAQMYSPLKCVLSLMVASLFVSVCGSCKKKKKIHVYNGMALKENYIYLLSSFIQTIMGKAGGEWIRLLQADRIISLLR